MIKIFVFVFVILECFPVTGSSQNKEAVNKESNDTFEYFVAPVGPQNPRNSEAAIVPLKDGSLLLGWTEFYADKGADHGPARLSGKRGRARQMSSLLAAFRGSAHGARLRRLPRRAAALSRRTSL